jgi:hypothetical protein
MRGGTKGKNKIKRLIIFSKVKKKRKVFFFFYNEVAPIKKVSKIIREIKKKETIVLFFSFC